MKPGASFHDKVLIKALALEGKSVNHISRVVQIPEEVVQVIYDRAIKDALVEDDPDPYNPDSDADSDLE
jgi:hypothetical protein